MADKICKTCKHSTPLNEAGWPFSNPEDMKHMIECAVNGFTDGDGNINSPDWYPNTHTCEKWENPE